MKAEIAHTQCDSHQANVSLEGLWLENVVWPPYRNKFERAMTTGHIYLKMVGVTPAGVSESEHSDFLLKLQVTTCV